MQDANLRGIPQNPTQDPDIFFSFNARPRTLCAVAEDNRRSRVAGADGRPRRCSAATLASRSSAVQSLQTLVEQQLSASRFLTWLTGVFAATALTLAIIGIYGLLAYWVGQRTREIGVRAALGAGRGQLMALVVGQGLGLAMAGVVIGAGAAVALGRFVESQLYAVQPLDVVSFVGARRRDDRHRARGEPGAGHSRAPRRPGHGAAQRLTVGISRSGEVVSW